MQGIIHSNIDDRVGTVVKRLTGRKFDSRKEVCS